MKTIVKYIIGAIILSIAYGVYHSLTYGRCVDHTHSFELGDYLVTAVIYFIALVLGRAVGRYFQAVNR